MQETLGSIFYKYNSKQCMRKLGKVGVNKPTVIIIFLLCVLILQLVYIIKYADIDYLTDFQNCEFNKNLTCQESECGPTKVSDDLRNDISHSLSKFESYYIQRRLQLSSQNWMEFHIKRYKTEKNSSTPYSQNSNWSQIVELRTIWDYFTPSFDCPYIKERVGRLGDGGKWICGFRELAMKNSCLVYSFGVLDDTSFEEEILKRTKCRVRMFDPTIRNIPQLLNNFPQRATFDELGLYHKEFPPFFATLKSIMKKYGDTYIEVLKIDIEGSEWASIGKIIEVFGDVERLIVTETELTTS